jgi:ElaB/YqjD/DUF883 family membrane-anchored ribosome-binding protein
MRNVGRTTRHRVGDTVSSGARMMDENLSEAAERSRGFIRDNPVAACATAAAVGFAIALLLRR